MFAVFKAIFAFIKGIFSSWRLLIKMLVVVACILLIWFVFSKLNIFSPISSILKYVWNGFIGVFDFIKGLSPLKN